VAWNVCKVLSTCLGSKKTKKTLKSFSRKQEFPHRHPNFILETPFPPKLRLHYKYQPVSAVREMTEVCSENHTKQTNVCPERRSFIMRTQVAHALTTVL